MKYIGIDYGTKKTGVAISDPLGTLAFPREVLVTNTSLARTIADTIESEEVTGVVVGESRDLSGVLNPVAADAQSFVKSLQDLINKDVDIFFEDERFTTKQARTLPNEGVSRGDVARQRPQQNATKADAQAAALILQSFLDKQRNSS